MLSRQFIKDNVVRFNRNVKRYMMPKKSSHITYIYAWFDELFSLALCGASPDDYFRYQFYRKNWRERRKFVVWRKGKELVRKHNSKKTVPVFNDKRLMNEALGDFIGRRWIDLSRATREQLEDFADSVGNVIMKPYGGAGGHGIFILSREECRNICIDDYREYIAEEILIQHPILAELNSSSVNTVRAMTFHGELLSCVLKVGRGGAVVDNMCSQGMYGNINMQYDLTDSLFYDIGLNEYAFHPTSGARLIGVEIPNWNELEEMVCKAAKLFPDVEYIGWDCAILQDKVVIIEANEAPGHDLSCQSTKQEGIYERIKEIQNRRRHGGAR